MRGDTVKLISAIMWHAWKVATAHNRPPTPRNQVSMDGSIPTIIAGPSAEKGLRGAGIVGINYAAATGSLRVGMIMRVIWVIMGEIGDQLCE